MGSGSLTTLPEPVALSLSGTHDGVALSPIGRRFSERAAQGRVITDVGIRHVEGFKEDQVLDEVTP